jgi:hypothetical protein
LGTEPFRSSQIKYVEQFIKDMQEVRKEAEAALHRAADDMARYYDQPRKEADIYKPGDKAWLEGRDIQTDRPSKKLEDKRYGPFEITQVIGPNAYELKLPSSMKIHPVFNVAKLRPFHEDTIQGRIPPVRPPPVVKGETPEWEVNIAKIADWKGENYNT